VGFGETNALGVKVAPQEVCRRRKAMWPYQSGEKGGDDSKDQRSNNKVKVCVSSKKPEPRRHN